MTLEDAVEEFRVGNNAATGSKAAEFLSRVVCGNIIKSPQEPKYRKIKTSSAKFSDVVMVCRGAVRLLTEAGFVLDHGELSLPESADVEMLKSLQGYLVGYLEGLKREEEDKRRAAVAERQEAMKQKRQAEKERAELVKKQMAQDQKDLLSNRVVKASHATELHFGSNMQVFQPKRSG